MKYLFHYKSKIFPGNIPFILDKADIIPQDTEEDYDNFAYNKAEGYFKWLADSFQGTYSKNLLELHKRL